MVSGEKLVVFEDKKIRRALHNGEWYFSIIDVIEVLSSSVNPRRYWSDLKMQLAENEGFVQLYGKIVQLKLESTDGKKYETDVANTETMFRIIQSIPSLRLNVMPSRCLVFEDTSAGVEAASGAGMIAIAIPNQFTSEQDFSKAITTIESHANLPLQELLELSH